jgi:hypothetical protein
MAANRLPPEARRTADRDNLDRAIPAAFHCPECDDMLASYTVAMLSLSVDAHGEDGDVYASWSETIGATVVLAPGLVNRRDRHYLGLPAYGPGKRRVVGGHERPALRIRLPAIVTCRCGVTSRLVRLANQELAEAHDESRDEMARQIFEEQQAAERRDSWRQKRILLKERLTANRRLK